MTALRKSVLLELLMCIQMISKACKFVCASTSEVPWFQVNNHVLLCNTCALPYIGPVVAGFVAKKAMLNSKPTRGGRGRWHCQSRLFGHGQPSNHSPNGSLAAVWLLRRWHWSSILSSAYAHLTQLKKQQAQQGSRYDSGVFWLLLDQSAIYRYIKHIRHLSRYLRKSGKHLWFSYSKCYAVLANNR